MIQRKLSAFALVSALALGAAACGGPPPAVGATPSPDLESMIKQQAETAAPESEQVGGLLRGVAYDRGEFEEFRVEVQAGQCYTFVAAADATIEVIDFLVWDGKGSRVGRDKKKDRTALVQHCAEETGINRIQAKIAKGAGHFAVGVFKKDAPEKVAVVETKEAKLDLDAIIEKDAAQVAPGSTKVNSYTATGEKNDFYVQLEKGTCYWFIGAAQAQVDDYYIYLWDQNKKRIGETKADSHKAQFGHCATVGAMYHVQIKVDDASDEVRMGIYSKKQ